MLFGLVVVVYAVQMVFRGKEDPKDKKQKKGDVKYRLLKSKQRLAKLTELNKVYDEQKEKLQREIGDLKGCIDFQKKIIDDRKKEFEHLESVCGICHCNDCIEADIKANRKAGLAKKVHPKEELWIE
ncbi:unnamed protein product [Owenia fusiformis]|uniref:Uncharacterized protein n=1 Tax=Owenia fusiformis TaxID=6347 RepID=A0A8J1Y4Q4_OWEFU|nr:unnamed protein product [Owenia fusiformis]